MLLKGAVIHKPFLLGFFVCRDVSVSIPEQTKQIIYILYDDIGKRSQLNDKQKKSKTHGKCMILTGTVIYKPFLLGFFVCRDVPASIPEQTKQIIYVLYDDIG